MHKIIFLMMFGACLGITGTTKAETFNLYSGEVLDGTIFESMGSTFIIALSGGGLFPASVAEINYVRIASPEGGETVGKLVGRLDGVYELLVDGTLRSVRDDGSLLAASPEQTSFGLATHQLGGDIYILGIAISTVVKLKLLPNKEIDLVAFATKGLDHNISLLNQRSADFALLAITAKEGLPQTSSLKGIRSVAVLLHEGETSLQLVGRDTVDEAIVYHITQTIFENLSILQGIHRDIGAISLDAATTNLALPLHEGAKRYYEQFGSVPEEKLPM